MDYNEFDRYYYIKDRDAVGDFTGDYSDFGIYAGLSYLIETTGSVSGTFYLDVGIGTVDDISWDNGVSLTTCNNGLFSGGKNTDSFNIDSYHMFTRIRFVDNSSVSGSNFSIKYHTKSIGSF